jgi:hypothetical protein
MQSSLIPERPLVISPMLAATIGLEEAVMLHVLSELISHRECEVRNHLRWVELDTDTLVTWLPFWAPIDIKRVQRNLQELGLVLIDAIDGSSGRCRYAINQRVEPDPAQRMDTPSPQHSAPSPSSALRTPPPANAQGANYIASTWQPSADCIRQCRQHGIPETFIQAQVPGFVMYWRERRQSKFSWGNAFYKHVLREWRQEQTRQGAGRLDTAMSAQWRPSADALSILENAGINRAFIEDSIPEFVLYWRERGIVEGAWNSRFIDHIRRQWARYSATLEHDGMPRPIPEDWQPSAACFDILRMAEIDEGFARGKISEFVMYWRDTLQPHASWNTRFLQYIKFNWAKRLEQLQNKSAEHAGHQSLTGRSGQNLAASFERFTDRSWAE